MPTQSEALLEAYASCPPDVKVYETLEINHPSFAAPVYIVANVGDDMQFTLENAGSPATPTTFTACPLKCDYPEQRKGQAPSAKVTIDNVARELVPQIRAALGVRAYITITYREYLGSDTSEPAYGPIEFILSNVQMVAASLTGTVVVRNLQNKQFPRRDKYYSYTQFRSLLPG